MLEVSLLGVDEGVVVHDQLAFFSQDAKSAVISLSRLGHGSDVDDAIV